MFPHSMASQMYFFIFFNGFFFGFCWSFLQGAPKIGGALRGQPVHCPWEGTAPEHFGGEPWLVKRVFFSQKLLDELQKFWSPSNGGYFWVRVFCGWPWDDQTSRCSLQDSLPFFRVWIELTDLSWSWCWSLDLTVIDRNSPQDRVQKGIVHLNEILHGPVPKTSEEDRRLAKNGGTYHYEIWSCSFRFRNWPGSQLLMKL